MSSSLQIGDIEIYWLNGGEFALDGGTMYGAVPKVLWSKVYPSEDNYIQLVAKPLLIRTADAWLLVETGIGNKLTEKQKKIFRVNRNWSLPDDLPAFGITRKDIDMVILTHLDFDHAGGIVMHGEDGNLELTFPNAKHIIQEMEWHDAIRPNRRAAHTYWEQNLSMLSDSGNLQLVDGNQAVLPGIEVIHTGGHTRGHQIVRVKSGQDVAYHLADLLPTHAHFNPLWIMAYDNFPLDVVKLKEELAARILQENGWVTFYHDPFMDACKFDGEGKIIEKKLHTTPEQA